MIPFESKRNQVYPVLWRGRAAVEKHFTHQEDWHRETELYRVLSGRLPVPSVLEERPGVLVTEFCPYPTLLQVLEEQERRGFSSAPWMALATWLERCHTLCEQLPLEGNLRNFLWDHSRGKIVGLDLESYQLANLQDCGGEIIGGLLTYAPEDTPVKKQAANLLKAKWNVPEEKIAQAKSRFRDRRRNRGQQPISGIILAGAGQRKFGTPWQDVFTVAGGKTASPGSGGDPAFRRSSSSDFRHHPRAGPSSGSGALGWTSCLFAGSQKPRLSGADCGYAPCAVGRFSPFAQGSPGRRYSAVPWRQGRASDFCYGPADCKSH